MIPKQKHSAPASRQAQQTEEKEKESVWKQSSTYLLIASGVVVISLLSWGSYWLLSRNRKKTK